MSSTSDPRSVVDVISTCSKDTGINIAGHPLATELKGIKTADQVLEVYQARATNSGFENYLGKDQILVDLLLPIVHAVYSLSLLGEALSAVCN